MISTSRRIVAAGAAATLAFGLAAGVAAVSSSQPQEERTVQARPEKERRIGGGIVTAGFDTQRREKERRGGIVTAGFDTQRREKERRGGIVTAGFDTQRREKERRGGIVQA